MVKTPRARHPTRKKEPVTIELGPDQVSRINDPAEPAEQAKDAAPENGTAAAEDTEPAADSSRRSNNSQICRAKLRPKARQA